MKRIQEKVKDIVEVRPYESLRDFAADPARTLSAYYFTDSTAELMAKWLDRIANVGPGNGAAMALAGYRGVGKSHFLSAFGAFVSFPELRSRVTDAHVAASATRLLRRHYPVAHVRRGTHATLLDEFRAAMATSLGTEVSQLPGSVEEIMKAACTKSGELPFILMIDTALERGTRVARDDGPFLSEVAEIAKGMNIFLGVALDDDIAGADGSNSAIVRSFNIDYLDPEHLYKVVNAHIFPKHSQMLPVLRDIYTDFREVLPSFRWSEQRFASLYPLHPVILEVAPFVRLYVYDFALLGFASTAAERILGRPATSLIALDEVFDAAEAGLRKIEDLQDAFAAYDRLNGEVVAKIPVLQRLQAKLILKALLLLSLEGQGTTAGEISAAMLIFDESDPQQAVKIVHDIVKKFADALPEDIQIIVAEGRETRYGFKVSSKENLNKALAERIQSIPDETVTQVLRRLMQDRFSDWTLPADAVDGRREWMDCQVEWRGGMRRGRIAWASGSTDAGAAPLSDWAIDWEVVIALNDRDADSWSGKGEIPRVFWRPAELTNDERDTIQRYHALTTDAGLREEFGEQIRASLHAHSLSVSKILNRIFLEDGKLVIDGFDYNCTEEARMAQSLSQLFNVMLEPLFETRYPEHPRFAQTLGISEVATLVSDLYSGARQNITEVQHLAHTFALPLKLVRQHGGIYVPETEENVAALPLASAVIEMVQSAGNETVALRAIYSRLRKEPHGLVREAQHLILAALVAQRQIEFVTSKGDRISRRSLDLKIIWDDIVGVAKPAESQYSVKKLVRWAVILTGNKEIRSLDSQADLGAVRGGFVAWLDEWRKAAVLERFGELPDEILNTRIWRLASRSAKTLGSVAENIKAALSDSISIEECLNRIADTFSDSEEQFERANSELIVVDSFTKGVPARQEIYSYLAGCEISMNNEIEELREQLIDVVEMSFQNPSDASNREMGYLWIKFQRDYAEHFAEQHDLIMRSHSLQEQFDAIMQGDEWWEFENLSGLDVFNSSAWNEAKRLRQQLQDLDCRFDVREALKTRPFCMCSFSLAKAQDWERLPQQLTEAIRRGLVSYRSQFAERRENVLSRLQAFSQSVGDNDSAAAANRLAQLIKDAAEIPPLSDSEMKVMQTVFAPPVVEPPPVKVHKTPEGQAAENPPVIENDWARELTDDAVILNV